MLPQIFGVGTGGLPLGTATSSPVSGVSPAVQLRESSYDFNRNDYEIGLSGPVVFRVRGMQPTLPDVNIAGGNISMTQSQTGLIVILLLAIAGFLFFKR